MNKLLTISEVAEIIGVTHKTLQRWDSDNTLPSVRITKGKRRYDPDVVQKFVGQYNAEPKKDRPVCVYCRVSSHQQKKKGDLDRQKNRMVEFCARQGYKVEYILEDVGSGLSGNRPKLKTMFELVKGQKISRVVVEHKDRLTRFQFNVFEEFFGSHGVLIEYVDDGKNLPYEQEFANDIMALIASFSGKFYGKRSGDRRKLKKIEKEKIK
jgi:excisionase family DNA binding protein